MNNQIDKEFSQTENLALTPLLQRIESLGTDISQSKAELDDVNKTAAQLSKAMHLLETALESVHASNGHVRTAVTTSKDQTEVVHEAMSSARHVMTHALRNIEQLSSAVIAMNGQLEGLESSLKSVREFSSSIDGIARQTNLLALNATIEAARAGEAGRGFAVVAGEVKALSRETGKVTEQIDQTIAHLGEETKALTTLGTAALQHVSGVEESTNAFTEVFSELDTSIELIAQSTATIGDACNSSDEDTTRLTGEVGEMAQIVDRNHEMLTSISEGMMQTAINSDAILADVAIADPDGETAQIIDDVQWGASEISRQFTAALEAGKVTLSQLFDRNYVHIDGTNPKQYLTEFTQIAEQLLPAIQEPLLNKHEKTVLCVATDPNGYIPTHNAQYSKPQRDDPVWNMANCRNRMIFSDRVGLASGQNEKPFLLQTYRRDMGGGKFALLKDISAPIYIEDLLWGNLRIAYRV
ncbi:methyl-accepting chemotaxis protein [Polycladidibacter stylochi]|uniref:methyl-accepting chemotaxis protein n=1 Tax=Polycladidibacter stylochi TaxID=1807766 RepID=UPI00082BF600|nr:methyl-accepting chemotaxis protein [Pseudovibrio stylochi]